MTLDSQHLLEYSQIPLEYTHCLKELLAISYLEVVSDSHVQNLDPSLGGKGLDLPLSASPPPLLSCHTPVSEPSHLSTV